VGIRVGVENSDVDLRHPFLRAADRFHVERQFEPTVADGVGGAEQVVGTRIGVERLDPGVREGTVRRRDGRALERVPIAHRRPLPAVEPLRPLCRLPEGKLTVPTPDRVLAVTPVGFVEVASDVHTRCRPSPWSMHLQVVPSFGLIMIHSWRCTMA